MELLNVVGVLLRHRLALGVGVLLAAAVGLAAVGAFSSAPAGNARGAGIALARVQIDTPRSMTAAAVAKGAVTIHQRAFLLADLMASDGARTAVARLAGLRPGELIVLGPTSVEPPVTPGLPERAGDAARAAAYTNRHVLMYSVDAMVPLMSVSASAPDAASAGRLAAAGVAGMREATAGGFSHGGGVMVEQLGPVQSRDLRPKADGRKPLAVIAALAVFCAWCTAIVICAGAARLWRTAGVRPQEAV
jgi:hypothetical protein